MGHGLGSEFWGQDIPQLGDTPVTHLPPTLSACFPPVTSGT